MTDCPITVKDIKVRSLSVDYNEVSWEVTATKIDVLDFTFQVLRSEGPEGPWDKLSDEFDDQYLFVDNAVMALHRYRTWFYKIRVKRKGDKETWDFGPATQGQDVDLIGGEVRSHISLLMHEFVGERVWVLPVRTSGTRCTSCYSVTMRNKTRSGCRTCWDTSFVRGYMHPIESWISFDRSPKASQFTALGKLQQNDTTARMPYFPPLKPGDVIVSSATVQRWSVVQVSSAAHVGTRTHQELQVHEIPQSDIEYDIPLKLCDELKNMFLKPARNFTNPQNLEALDKETTDGIFSLYNTNSCGEPPCR